MQDRAGEQQFLAENLVVALKTQVLVLGGRPSFFFAAAWRSSRSNRARAAAPENSPISRGMKARYFMSRPPPRGAFATAGRELYLSF